MYHLRLCYFFLGDGCTQQGETPLEPPSPEAYRINFSPETRIAAEYDTYKFEFSEQRPVYVGGFRDASNQRVVWVVDHTNRRLDYWGLKNARNAYFNSATGEYTAPLNLRAPFDAGQYTYTFYLGYAVNETTFVPVYNRTATIQVFSRWRTYYIEYSCMGATYDLRNTGYQFRDKVTGAYGEAGTFFRIDNVFNTNIPVSDLPNIHEHRALIDYGDSYASGGVNHNPNTVVLFGMRDHNDGTLPGAVGITAWDLRSPSPRKSYSFVFGKRIDDSLSDPQHRQIRKTRTSIHELAHARGKDEYTTELGDVSHTYHQGQYRDICVMGPPNYEPEKAFHFCEWMKQVLLNIIW